MNRIDFYFEGKSYLNAFWKDREDAEWEEQDGWMHGASPFGTQPFYSSNFEISDTSKLIKPAALFQDENLKAFAFEQILDSGLTTYQILEPFGSNALISKELFDEKVASDNAYENTIWWTND